MSNSKPKYKKKTTITKNNEVVNNKEVVNNLTIPNVYSESEIVEEIDMSKISGITFDPANLTHPAEEECELQDTSNKSAIQKYREAKLKTEELLLDAIYEKSLNPVSNKPLSHEEIRQLITIYKAFEESLYGKDRYDVSFLGNEYIGFSQITAPIPHNSGSQFKIENIEDFYDFTKAIWSSREYDGRLKKSANKTSEIPFEITFGNETNLTDGRHFLRECIPFGLQDCGRVCIYIPNALFDDVMNKYTVDESVYFEACQMPTAEFGRKILNGSFFPAGNVVHHFNFPAFYEDIGLFNKCFTEMWGVEYDDCDIKKAHYSRSYDDIIYKTLADMELMGTFNTIRAVSSYVGPTL